MTILLLPVFELIQSTQIVLNGHLIGSRNPETDALLRTVRESRVKVFDQDENLIDVYNSVFSSSKVRQQF